MSGAVVPEGEADPAVWLSPYGYMCLFDLYVPLVTPSGYAAVSPSYILVRADRLPALPPLTRTGDAFDLRQIIENPQHPARHHERVLVGPPVPEHKLLDIELVHIRDSDTGRDWLQLRLLGPVLHFVQRGRHVEYDLTAFTGHAVVIAVRWNPSTLSIEVQGSSPSAEPVIAIGFGRQPTMAKELRDIVEGETIDVDADKRAQQNAPIVDRGIALAFLVKRGTKLEQVEPMMRRVAKEAADVLRRVADSGGVHAPAGLIALAHYALLVEVDDERWQRWKTTLERSDDWIGEVDFAFVRFPLPEPLLASATSTLARAFSLRLDQMAGTPPGPGLIPPLFVDEQDVLRWFWVHATLGHILVDDLATEMKAEIQERVRVVGIRESAESIRLDVSNIQMLFDVVGREWLKRKVEKRRRKKAAAAAARSQVVARFFDADDTRNTAIDSFSAFTADVDLRLVPETGALLELFTAARTLSSLLEVVRDHAPDMVDEVATRLRAMGEDAARAEFEVETLALLLSLGHRAAFVPTESQRTPDIVVNRPGGDVYVECARKDALSADAQATETFVQELTKFLDSQAHKYRASYRLDLRFDAPFQRGSQQSIIQHIKALIQERGGEFVDEPSQISGRLTPLGEWGRVWRTSTLESLIATASRVYITGDFQEGWSVTGYIFHATLVSLTFQTSRRLVNSIENTLRDKGKARSKGGQVPDGMPTVCAISLGTVDDATVGEVLAAAPRLLEARSAVSALVLFWSKRVAENYVPMAFGWRAATFRNPKAKNPLPDDFRLPDGPLMVTGVQKNRS